MTVNSQFSCNLNQQQPIHTNGLNFFPFCLLYSFILIDNY
jgi:hypothetical protein